MRKLILALLLFVIVMPVFADQAEPTEDPAIEERFKQLTLELRCLKCQNQTIYDSKAGLADDLRRQIREQIYAGKSDSEIVDYLVARYGDFVRYRPSFGGANLMLWVGPFILLVIGITMLIIQIRKRRAMTEEAPLSADDEKRVQSLIKEQGGES